ncbi:MAG: hypothetical protein RSB39_08665 [Oscillospiraceae bacterium]
MLKRKDRMIYGILICILLCAVGTPASAEPPPAKQTQDEPISGVEVAASSVDDPQARGKAAIEEVFPAKESTSVKGECSTDSQTPDKQVDANGELPINYEQKGAKTAEQTTTETEIAANFWFTPIFIITAVIIASVLLAVCLIKKFKTKREENQ